MTIIHDEKGQAISEFPEVGGNKVIPVEIQNSVLPNGASTSTNQVTTNTKLDSLLTELEKKADITETQPVREQNLDNEGNINQSSHLKGYDYTGLAWAGVAVDSTTKALKMQLAAAPANMISITDTGSYFVGTEVETALQEIGLAITTTENLWDKSGTTISPHTPGDTIAWATVSKTSSNLADLATKSHTSLTDIGTNTHAQIDTHLAGTLAVHTATTSAQLAGVISDETGSGALVFGTSPTFTTQITTPLIIGTNIKPSADSTTAIQLQNAAGTNVLNIDTTNSRVGIGTTSPASPLSVVKTLPTGTANGGVFTITGSGSSGLQSGLKVTLLAGYTGNGSSIGLYAQNQSAGISTDEFNNAQSANYGEYIATTTGYIVGQAGYAAGGNRSYGGMFRSIVAKNSATNIGVAGYALNTGTSPIQIGGYFGLQNSSPTFESAALIADNSTQTSPILLARDNGSTVFGVYDGGNVGIGTTSPTNLLSLGGNSARIFWMERHTTANTAGNTLTVQAGGATSGATDKAGGDLILQPGVSTGSAESGVQIKGCVAGVSGTADRTITTAIQVLGNKIGFYNTTPVAQQTGIAAQKTDYTAGDLDTEAEIITALNTTNTAINALRTALNNLGLTTIV